jgi:hypothetical protein
MSNSYTIPDPRDWADIILDDAPPCPPQYKRQSVAADPVPRPYQQVKDDSLLAKLLALGRFTADYAAGELGCYPSSVRMCVRNYPTLFTRVNAMGSGPAVWRVIAQP